MLQRDQEQHRDSPSVVSVPMWPRCPGLSQFEARRLELHLGFPQQWAGAQVLALFTASLTCSLAGSQIRSRVARTKTSFQMECQVCGWWLKQPWHNTSPSSFHLKDFCILWFRKPWVVVRRTVLILGVCDYMLIFSLELININFIAPSLILFSSNLN